MIDPQTHCVECGSAYPGYRQTQDCCGVTYKELVTILNDFHVNTVEADDWESPTGVIHIALWKTIDELVISSDDEILENREGSWTYTQGNTKAELRENLSAMVSYEVEESQIHYELS